MSWIRGRIPTVVLACALALTGCSGGSGGDSQGSLPQGPQTLQQASNSMRDLKSVAFTISTEGDPVSFPVKSGEVRLLRNGDAEGRLHVQVGMSMETEFVLLGDVLYYKGLTGGYEKASKEQLRSLYDPSAVLDPERGIAKLLTAARGVQPEAREKVGGKDAYRVKVTLPKQEIEGLIPGVDEDLQGQVWISADDHRLLKVRGELPPSGGKGAVVITFTEFNADYRFKAPI